MERGSDAGFWGTQGEACKEMLNAVSSERTIILTYNSCEPEANENVAVLRRPNLSSQSMALLPAKRKLE